MKRKLMYDALYSLVGLVTYLLFLYLTFPSDVARERLVYEANKAGVRMQMVGFRPSPPWGLSLTGVDIYGFGESSSSEKRGRRGAASKGLDAARSMEAAIGGPGADVVVPDAVPAADGAVGAVGAPEEALPGGIAVPGAATGSEGATVATTGGAATVNAAASAEPAEAPLLSFDRLRIASLLPLLSPSGLSGMVNFDGDLYGGEVEGAYGKEGEDTRIALKLNDLDLARYPMQGESFDMKTSGRFGLNVDLLVNKEKIRDSTGKIDLALQNLIIHKGSKVKGFDIPLELAFKVSGGAMEVKNGRADLTELKLESPPLTILVSGSVTLNAVPARSRFNLKVSLKFGDELKVVSAFLPETARSDDGFYHYILSGPFDNLRTRPDRLAARRKDRGRPTAAGGSSDFPDRPTPPGIGRPPMPDLPGPLSTRGDDGGSAGFRPPILDDAERERLREERRKRAEERRKRREELRQRRLDMTGEDGMAPPPMGLESEVNQEDSERPSRRVRNNEEPSGDNGMPEGMEGNDEPQPWDEPGE